jgi:FkbM family methyltransferase
MGTGFVGISTNTKVRIAQGVSLALRGARRLAGLGPIVETERGGLRWRLDLREGIDLALFLGVYEPHVAKGLPRLVQQGDVVIDIGANIGAQTLPLARLVGAQGQVVAVEPTRYAVQKLRTNLGLNPDLAARTTVVQAMLGEEDGSLAEAIPSSWPLAGDRSDVDADFAGKPQSTEGARALSLDALVDELRLKRIDLIKLDVDGHEGTVLAGAKRTLARFAPQILIEIAPYLQDRRPGGFDRLLAQIKSLGYTAEDLEDGSVVPLRREAFGTDIAASRDVLLRPGAMPEGAT